MRFNYDSLCGLDIFEGVPQTRSAIRLKLGEPTKILPKTAFSQNSADVYGNSALRVWYTSEDEITGVELYYPEVEFFLLGTQVLGFSVFELELLLKYAGLEVNYEEDGSGINSKNGQLRFYAPDISERKEQAKVLAVYIEIR